jgi:hypothetical protein
MERGSRIYPPCLAASAESRPLEQCRISFSIPSRAIARSPAASARCRKRDGAVTSHHHKSKESGRLQ